ESATTRGGSATTRHRPATERLGPMSVPTPLLDFFRRGEVARDVRLLAAQGAVAPRAHEQLSILILLLDDPDPEVRSVASQTMARIPGEALVSFLGRADVSVDVREVFADR